MSRWFVGSSSSSNCAPLKSTFASCALLRCPPLMSPRRFVSSSSVNPRPISAERVRLLYVMPPLNSYSSLSACWRFISVFSRSPSAPASSASTRFSSSSASISGRKASSVASYTVWLVSAMVWVMLIMRAFFARKSSPAS